MLITDIDIKNWWRIPIQKTIKIIFKNTTFGCLFFLKKRKKIKKKANPIVDGICLISRVG
jgi:hypothetical protein